MPELSRLHTLYGNSNLFDGRYRLGEGRWEGAVGVVREAFDTSANDLRVVIKHPDPYLGPEMRAYKEQLLDLEAEALQRLDGQPQVCRMLGQGRMGSGPASFRYLVIEWADGQPVSGLVQRLAGQGSCLPIGTVLTILVQLADVLAQAHRQGLINNDVDVKHLYWNQPARSLKVIDWGNAKLVSQGGWDTFTLRDDVTQFADVMYCLLTGHTALDAAQPDLAFWQQALSDVLPAVREDLAAIGQRACSPDGYQRAIELHADLIACQMRLRATLSGPLQQVDALLKEASPESLARADDRLAQLAEIAPVDEGVLERTATLERIRRERREASAMQLGSAYVKAGSWLEAVEVLSRTFGHQVDPQTAPGLLLAAAKLVDARRALVGQDVESSWAAAAKALTDRHVEDALDLYLSVPEDALDTTVEPVRSLLAISGRYVLRHELRVLVRSLAELRDAWKNDPRNDGNSHSAVLKTQVAQVGRAHRELRLALTALCASPPNDWTQQDAAYRRIALALQSCLRVPDLPAGIRRHLEGCSERAQELTRRCDDLAQALQDEAFDVAAEQLAAIPRIDPDNASAPRQGERLPRLAPLFQRIRAFDGWAPSAWSTLEEGACADVEAAFGALPGSSLKTRTLDLARERIRERAAQREEEHLAEGLALLQDGQWRAARGWAVRVHARHADWEPATVVMALADAYEALFDPDEIPHRAAERADEALGGLSLAPEQDALRIHKRRLEVMTECCQHLASDDEATQNLAEIVVQNLPEGDPCREDLMQGIEVTRALRAAVRASRWEDAQAAAQRLGQMRMPVMAGVAARWRGVFQQLDEAERLRDEGRYPEALACLERARLLTPPVELGRPAPSVLAMQEGLSATRERLAEEWAALQAPPPEPAVVAPSPASAAATRAALPVASAMPAEPTVRRSDSALQASHSQGSSLAGRLRAQDLPSGREVAQGAGAWLSRASEWVVATLEARPVTPRQSRGGTPTTRRGTPLVAPAETAAGERAAGERAAGERAAGERAAEDHVADDSERDPASEAAPDLASPRHRTARQSDVLGWAIGGASLVGVVTLAVALALSRDGGAGRNAPGGLAEAGIAAVRELISAGDATGAAARLAELQAQQGSTMDDTQRAAVQTLDDCLWLSAQGGAVAPERFREDLERLAALWGRAEARGLAAYEAECPSEGGVQAAVAAAARVRQAYLQAVLDQGGAEAWEGVAATLDGLDLGGLDGLLAADATFSSVGAQAQAGLAEQWLAAGDCERGGQALDALTRLVAGNGALAGAVSLEDLAAQRDSCAGAQARCSAVADLGAADASGLGEDLRLLAEAGLGCAGVPVADLFSARLAALQTLAEQGDPAEAIAAAMQISGTSWFADPPQEAAASPSEIVAGAYTALLATRCGEEPCADGVPATTQAEAETFYAEYRAALGPQPLIALVGALRRAGSTCANCGLASAAETVPLDLLDSDLGEWSDHGMYSSGTGRDLAWHLNDVFVKKEQEPAYQVPVAEGGATQPLYETAFVAAGEDAPAVAVRLNAKMVTLKGAIEGWRALWGLQVPGSDRDPLLLVVLWNPDTAPGRWGLLIWRPSSDSRQLLPLPDGPLDQAIDLRVDRGLDGDSYEVTWQGDIVLAGQPLPQNLDASAVRFLVGEGAHAWIQTATADVAR